MKHEAEISEDLNLDIVKEIRKKFSKSTDQFFSDHNWEESPLPLFGIDFGTSNTVISHVNVRNPSGVSTWKSSSGKNYAQLPSHFTKALFHLESEH